MSLVSAQQSPAYKACRPATTGLHVSRDMFHISVRILHAKFLLDIGCPRHERLRLLVRMRFAEIRQLHQHMLEIGKRFNTVCLCTFHQGIHNGTGLGSLCGIAEQPVLSAKGKGADGILRQVVGDRHLAVR